MSSFATNLYNQVDENQVTNNAGGLAYKVTPLERLERFLILGSEAGTYYVNARNHTFDNVKAVQEVLNIEGIRAVNKILEIGRSGRAPKHEPVLFALAVAASHKDENVRRHALDNMNSVVRTGTHLFHFIAYAHARRGWGRAFRRALSNWYLDKDASKIAYQIMKYQQRDGWSHRDVLRVAHPTTSDEVIDGIFKFVVSGETDHLDEMHDAHEWLLAAHDVKSKSDVDSIVNLITKYNLPREVLPTEVLKDKRVWDAMLPSMGLHAMLRNMRNMIKYGVIEQGNEATSLIIQRLSDGDTLRKSRVHPADVFKALKAIGWNEDRQKNPYADYSYGWDNEAPKAPQGLIRALEEAFYESFENIEPTGKSILLALDVSGSMGIEVGQGLGSAAEWSALMAMIIARSEVNAEFFAFSHQLVEFPLTGRESIQEVLQKMSAITMGGTNCALPMYWARKNKRQYDAFVVLTDSETWDFSGGYGWLRSETKTEDSKSELALYRKWKGSDDVAHVVVGMTATDFTVGDPSDAHTLNVVGMDSGAPAIISNFIKG